MLLGKEASMQDDDLKSYKKAKYGEAFAKENARAEYEEYRIMREHASCANAPRDLVEIKIKQAMSEGAFENLEGKGKPLDLESYFEAPEHLRVGYHFLKNAGFIPEEVRLSKEIEMLKEKLATATTEAGRQLLGEKISKAAMDYGFYMDYNKKFAKKLF
jgi:hypothetical protein